MRFVRPILMFVVGFGMMADVLLQTMVFYGVGVGIILLLGCEELAHDYNLSNESIQPKR